MTIRLADRALEHLEQIHAYIARDDAATADATVDRILRAMEQLLEHPKIGRAGRRPGTRELVQAPFVVAYRIEHQAILIDAVFHGNQNYSS